MEKPPAKEFFEYAKNNIVTIGTAGARTDDAVAVAMLITRKYKEERHG